MMLLDLADAARKSGLPVVEVDGWKGRGHGHMNGVRTIVAHHTATSAAAKGNYPSLAIVRDGRVGLSGPLAQLGLGRDGTVYVIAAGLAYHAGVVGNTLHGNGWAVGIEAEHPGIGSWNAKQYAAYVALCAALVEHYRLSADDVRGHKEVAVPLGRKIDPTFDMAAFRASVGRAVTERAASRAKERRLTARIRRLRARVKRLVAERAKVRRGAR